MPAKPSYSHKIPDLIQALEEVRVDWIDRRFLEEALGISKTVAWRLLKRLGATEGPGNTLCLARAVAIERLRSIGSVAEREVRRRARLEHYLEGMRAYVASQRTMVAADENAAALVNTRFGNLPPNVELRTRSLHVDFQDTAEFLRAVGAVVFALNNDYEAVRDFIDRT